MNCQDADSKTERENLRTDALARRSLQNQHLHEEEKKDLHYDEHRTCCKQHVSGAANMQAYLACSVKPQGICGLPM